MPEIFERVTIFTTKPVIGQYRFKDKLQIYPSKRKPIQKGRFFYPLIIEISFAQQGTHYYRCGITYGSDQLTKQIVEIHHLLSVVTQFFRPLRCLKYLRFGHINLPTVPLENNLQ